MSVKGMQTYTRVLVVVGVLLTVIGSIIMAVGLTGDRDVDELTGFMLAGGGMLLLGIALLLMGILFGIRVRKQAAALQDPNSFAYQTYGGHGGFTQFMACLNRQAQQSKQKKQQQGNQCTGNR